jgi:hypothetical protein
VRDQTGASVPAAEIELSNVATGVVSRQQTSEQGQFQFNAVPPGQYGIRAFRGGFRSYTLSGVRVEK